ncbi:diacylglycerol kinase [Corynebacterium aquilae DSM 44791]|uniref:dihydrofolate reductase n=1 Tax=Corynebacterium aquilae DSM 44791 TaxID=1431546 RepID=A0A1L7CEX1_9CORY|nr:diacylglycerol kinase [Corynebacterium aquilae DSM 44791]
MKAIWAQSTDGIIGDGQDMPWHLPEDLAHFKNATAGHPVVMGRATWESLPPRFRPLPGRDNIVISSRTPGPWSSGARVQEDLGSLPADGFIIGGGTIYAATIDQVDEVIVTEIDVLLAEDLGDTAVHAPDLQGFTAAEVGEWKTSEKGYVSVGAHDTPVRFRFVRYTR